MVPISLCVSRYYPGYFPVLQKRLARPLSILEGSVEKIGGNDLNFHVAYESRDELGKLCDSVEEMRTELLRDKKEMWRLIERQKELNAAFAHDLRTPLTVLRGYTDFLARYIPEGKISQEKLQATLELMAEHLKRLEEYSRTMKGIRSIEEVPFVPEKTSFESMDRKIEAVVFALNQVRDVEILYKKICAAETIGIGQRKRDFAGPALLLKKSGNPLADLALLPGKNLLQTVRIWTTI